MTTGEQESRLSMEYLAGRVEYLTGRIEGLETHLKALQVGLQELRADLREMQAGQRQIIIANWIIGGGIIAALVGGIITLVLRSE